MNPKTVSQLKNELLAKKKMILNLQEQNKQSPMEDENSMKDVIDRSDVEGEWFTKERMSRHWNTELSQINLSLQRIEAGTFGVCVECDADIPVKRLRVRPDATLCLDCQEIYEKENGSIRISGPNPSSSNLIH
jgi:DnaK suppressor protein